MEYIDVLNRAGERLGLQKSKVDVHRDGDWHKTVHVWCINDRGEILMQKRAEDKLNFPNYWDISVAGHISTGESPLMGALREIEEEIGVEAHEDDLDYVTTLPQEFVLHNGGYIDRELCAIYVMSLNKEIKDLAIQHEELSELKWISLRELRKWVEEKREDLLPHGEEYMVVFKQLGV